ncbi:MAG TPA: ATP-binding protein [Acetobacteraceae bacterium]|nr:ATP-binding protein [Acetobacteraceae bacterium]
MPSAAPPTARLALRNDPSEMARLAAWLDTIERDWALPPGPAHALRLCLDEAVVNVLTHGFRPGQPQAVEITLLRQPVLTAIVVDDGAPFDPTACALPPRPHTLEEAPAGGMGLRLLRHYATRLTHSRPDGRNRLEMEFMPDGEAPG